MLYLAVCGVPGGGGRTTGTNMSMNIVLYIYNVCFCVIDSQVKHNYIDIYTDNQKSQYCECVFPMCRFPRNKKWKIVGSQLREKWI